MSAASSASSAAVAELALDRERAAMSAADAQSFVAQRYFVRSGQLPTSVQLPAPQGRPQTWQAAYNELEADYQQVLDALREVRIANYDGIEELVGRELGHSSSEEAASSQWDGSEPESSDQEPPPAPQPGQRCARCSSTRNLELLLPTGRWADAPMEQRLFCDACIEAAA